MKKRLKLEPNNNNLIIWEAEQPKAVLQLVHGMVEYVERYEEFALAMNKEGFTVIGHDHLGHGHTAQNPSQLGVFPESPEELIDDIERVSSFIQESYPELPIVLLGHSMGVSYVSLLCSQTKTTYQCLDYHGDWSTASISDSIRSHPNRMHPTYKRE